MRCIAQFHSNTPLYSLRSQEYQSVLFNFDLTCLLVVLFFSALLILGSSVAVHLNGLFSQRKALRAVRLSFSNSNQLKTIKIFLLALLHLLLAEGDISLQGKFGLLL
jgi:predicted transglutaminase-like protease